MRDLPEANACVFRVTDNGLERTPLDAESLDAASARLPGGAYTTLRTYERRKLLRLDDHLMRLEQSARRLDPQMRVPFDRTSVKHALGQALDLTGFPDSRLRLTLAAPGGEFFIGVQPFAGLGPELYERGVAVATCPFVEHDTQAKSHVHHATPRRAG